MVKGKQKVRRGGGKNNKNNKNRYNVQLLNIFSCNAAGLKGKVNSLKCEIKKLDIGIFTIQETHFKSKGKVKCKDFEIFVSRWASQVSHLL